MRGPGGCLTKTFVFLLGAAVFVWAFTVLLNPWALHIGGQSTPLLYWHGAGTVTASDGRKYPLYLTFGPGRPHRSLGSHREGKRKNADLIGRAWLCISPGQEQRMEVSGTMYGGYASSEGALMDFRLLEWRKPFSINPQHRGFFDVAGEFHQPDLVMDRAGEQGIRLQSGPFINHATATLHWADREQFEAACRNMAGSN